MKRSMIHFFVRRFLRRTGAEEDLRAELQSHLELDIRQRKERGDSADSARQAALREFGNLGLVTEVTRDMWGFTWLEELVTDCHYTLRMLRKSVGLGMIVVFLLALGISTTTAIFTLLDGILLRPLPFPTSNQLVMIWEVPPETQKSNVVALDNFVAWKERSHSFQSMAAFFKLPMNLMDQRHQTEQVPGLAVTAEFFATLGTPPLLGRTFRSGEYWRDKPREVILSYRTWQSRFGANPDVIGKRISVDVTHLEIIGVMPPGFGFPNVEADLYTALPIDPKEGGRNFSVVGRLRRGVSVSAAKAEITAIAAHTAEENVAMNAGWNATVVPLLEQTVGNIRPVLLILFGATGLILLLVCSNVANLLLMHSAGRIREISVRLALGAGRSRIVRQLFTENLLLAISGGLMGIVTAVLLVSLMRHSLPESLHIPRLHDIALNRVVLTFAVGITAVSAVLFGLAPTLQALKRDLIRDLHAETRSVTSGRRIRNLLVVAEVALAVILVVASGLMVRSFTRLLHVNPGFHPEQVLTLQMFLLPVRDEQFHAEVVRNILTRVRASPGVVAAGSIGLLPMEDNSGTWYYRADQPEPAPSKRPAGDVSIITPGYFQALGIPILRGRDFDEHDRSGSMQVAILNQTAAQMFFPHEDPIGKRLKVWWNHSPAVEVVGVAGDIRHSQLNTPPDPCLFMPNDQQPFPFTSLVVRTSGDPVALTTAIRQCIREVDADQGVAKVETMTEIVADSIARPRVESLVLTAFGLIAIIVACMGLYGVIAYSVTQRSREIGIRLALGATASHVFRSVVADGLRLTTVGLSLGLAGVSFLVRYLRSLLFEVRPSDPLTLCSVVGLIAATSLLACYWPARRAIRIDPAVTLREE